MRRRSAGALLLAVTALLLLGAAPASAAFGLRSAGVSFANEDGSADTAAGTHPFEFVTSFSLNTEEVPDGAVDPETHQVVDGEVPLGSLKDLALQQIAGLVGSQTAVPRCTSAQFNTRSEGRPRCPDATAVGIVGIKAEFTTFPVGTAKSQHDAVYNLEPSPGEAAKLGFVALNVPITIDVGVSTAPPYELVAHLNNAPQSLLLYASEFILWGDPASPAHDALRGRCVGEPVESTERPVSLGSCPAASEGIPVPEAAFLTLPRSCAGQPTTVFDADSWEAPGVPTEPLAVPSAPFGDCAALGFAPRIEAGGTAAEGESPSGLDFDLEVDDPGIDRPDRRADSDIERAVVTLPEGFTTNPSVAAGLGACSVAQYEAEAPELDPATGCPESSKVGTVSVTSPLLEEPVGGQIYVARQGENTFHSLLALYMILRDEKNGILVKQPLKVEPDQTTGRLTTTVEEIPQLPFSDFHLHFRDGPRAPLTTPATCGRYTVGADLFPYASGVAPVHDEGTLTVSSGAGGSSCAATPAQLVHSPSFRAGTLDPTAGTYSPFVLDLARADGTQQISSIDTTLPGGLLGKLAGIPICPEPAIAQAIGRSGESQGAAEAASPSCPPASRVGTVTVAAGAGPEPLQVKGTAYLAGPYRGAPLSLEIVTPAIAGPFDLGVVAVRTALQVDPLTAQITAESDSIPRILHGLPLDLRSIAINLDRPGFTLNPTSCEPKAITGTAISTIGARTSLAQYFQARDCAMLGFKPSLKLSLAGGTKRTDHPALKAVLTNPRTGAYANVARAQVALPHSEFLDQANLDKVCKQADLKAGTCPSRSIYGRVRAWTPLLERPLEGPVYLAVGFGYKLPALVADLNGQIRVLLVGKIDSGKKKGIRTTFEAVPDAPVERFVLQLKGGSKYGLLENSEGICARPQRASARFVAQNGKVADLRPAIARRCGNRARRDKRGSRRGGVG
jgi:hypothetical protein